MSHLTQAELDRLLVQVQQRCDLPTQQNMRRLLDETRELREQAAERQHMYDLEQEA